MTRFVKKWNSLSIQGFLPDSQYISVKRFATNYKNTSELWVGIGQIALYPILNGVIACAYALRAVWEGLYAIGNLLILKPSTAANAMGNFGTYSTLSICLAVMAPIHALTDSLELITRLISSWFTGKETVEDLSNKGLLEVISSNAKLYGTDKLPSARYFRRSRFFSPYEDALDCIKQMASPGITIVDTGLSSLKEAAVCVGFAIECIANLLICKPKHAKENIRDVSAHFSLALGLAFMIPINALVEGVAFVSRLGSTWVSACIAPENGGNSNITLTS